MFYIIKAENGVLSYVNEKHSTCPLPQDAMVFRNRKEAFDYFDKNLADLYPNCAVISDEEFSSIKIVFQQPMKVVHTAAVLGLSDSRNSIIDKMLALPYDQMRNWEFLKEQVEVTNDMMYICMGVDNDQDDDDDNGKNPSPIVPIDLNDAL